MNRNHPNHRTSFGPFSLDPHTHELWKHNIKIKLARQPFEILTILLNHPGQLVTREELRAQLWPADTFVDFDHSLNAVINKLREALNDSADSPTYVETLPRRGYRFISTPVAQGESASPAAFSSSSVSNAGAAPFALKGAGLDSTSIDTESAKPQPRRFNPPTRPYILLASLFLALLLPATFLLKRVNSSTTHPTPASLPHIKPLTTLADETSQPAFSPSGEFVAFHRESSTPPDAGIFVQSLATGASAQLTRNPDDGWPTWSPDGRTIAFARYSGTNISLHLVPFSPDQLSNRTTAASETSINASPTRPELAFSPDGTALLYTAASGLVQLSLQNSATRSLTEAPPSSQDWGPAFSPDGRQLLFVRSGDTDFSDQLLVIPANGGEPTQIASEHARILGPPQWSADGQSIIFASGRGSHPGLWRVSAHLRDTPVQINDSGWYPAISRATSRLAYQRITRALNIWELDLHASAAAQNQPRILIPSTSETDQGPAPQISPDNKKIAYMSDRSGTMEIWVADRDGSHARQLTVIGDVGTPRWSPDSQSIAFDAGRRTGSAIYTITLDGAPPRLLTPDNHNVCPNWSRDSKWIYFASSRTGTFQVWKVPSAGGTPTQVTQHGGHAAIASLDGKLIYYAKSWYANPEIWQIPANGGSEKLLSPLVRPASWASWAVTDRGIVFATSSGKGKPIAALYDTATHRLSTLATLNIVPFWLSASPDASSLFFDQPGWQQAQIMLVDNFH